MLMSLKQQIIWPFFISFSLHLILLYLLSSVFLSSLLLPFFLLTYPSYLFRNYLTKRDLTGHSSCTYEASYLFKLCRSSVNTKGTNTTLKM